MDLFPTLPELLSILSLGACGLLLYGYIADRVVFDGGGRLHTEKFGPADIVAVALLGIILVLPVVDAIRSPMTMQSSTLPTASQMIVGVVASSVVLAIVVGGILGGLTARRIAWREVFGLDRQRPVAVLSFAVLLLVGALPLITVASLLSRLLLAAGGSVDDTSQELVRFLGSGAPRTARWVVGLSAVVAAPVLEEVIFRGYLYGVLRRYAGVTVGIICNALLFAAIHTHLPSFGGLFVLAVCLSLAYEWTGSIFVPIAMHALFNALSVVQLLNGGASGAFFHVR